MIFVLALFTHEREQNGNKFARWFSLRGLDLLQMPINKMVAGNRDMSGILRKFFSS
jgi:hypothetical protein